MVLVDRYSVLDIAGKFFLNFKAIFISKIEHIYATQEGLAGKAAKCPSQCCHLI
jgi:hypothetical protein